ncbi:MAG: Glu-tRNA(Gln) amidotransferase subunit GatE [Nanoarchaeota archaeon]|nr:Glu-tRNA(Gln) amidotransferase subunit GatE [Nanoarchaeota archaeon]MBU1643757.1 Glu-tRNA(Gln) amidotransferase subunit GatE [Nanoarchaeota archaeon]MBU1976644.1 Glu-tRNA(Gln) amidotransferase subunit GatE [Nanoarchaeota archaeon]
MPNQKLRLKCGIEIHQQLEGRKLFCSCPTLLRDDKPDFEIRRKLRATAGESGEIDVAAKQEQLRDKTFVYQGYYETTCLVETDSEPPHEINKDALYTSLQFSKIVKAAVSPIIQVMRKTVVDGSNTSGFQRTALIARGGKVETSEGVVRLSNISLEEDACKIISEKGDEKVYSLDRLGIPLIEIGTEPDIKSPEQCQETAKKLGMLLRSLSGVKRGLGTIRQDINVSIKGGTRIEIKGAQDLRILPAYVELEVKRQQELLKIKKELKKSKLDRKIFDLTSLLKDSGSAIIKKTLGNDGKILGLKLNHFSGFLGRELQPNYRLGTEFSGRAKIKAGVGGIFHSDELPNYGITAEEVKSIKKELKCSKEDAFVLVADKENKAILALKAVHERAEELFKGIPSEVRKANPDGTTSFMRPMPGAARMYPETDVPLVRPELKGIELPELLEQKIERFQHDFGLSKDLAQFIARSDKVMLFEELVQKYPNIKPAFIAETLSSTQLEIKRNYHEDPDKLNDYNFRELFKYLNEDKIHKDIILDVLIDMIKGNFNINKYASLSTEELHKTIVEIITANPKAPMGALMGLCMKKLAGKASGKIISESLKKILEKGHK